MPGGKVKTVIVTIAIALALVIPASAQWIRTEKKNLITGKTDVDYALASEPPEKASMILVGCGDGGDGMGRLLGIRAGFQVPDPGANEPPKQFVGGLLGTAPPIPVAQQRHLIKVPIRIDSAIMTVQVGVIGDLSGYVAFDKSWTRRILAGEIAKGIEAPAPKEVVIELREFGGATHQLVFKADKPLPVTLGKGGDPSVFCPAEPPQTAASATSK